MNSKGPRTERWYERWYEAFCML